MTIPDYQSIMLPLLKSLSDTNEHHVRQTIEKLAIEFSLTIEERKALLPSGLEPIFDNRVHWAKTYLKKAGLLDNEKRAHLKITQSGIDVLKTNPKSINIAFLKRYPEFIEFQGIKKSEKEEPSPIEDAIVTPEELLENSFSKLRASLADDLINKVVEMSCSSLKGLLSSF